METAVKLAVVADPPHPTAPDVDLLASELDYTEGNTIEHATIEAEIGAPHGSDRYQTVVSAWKRRMLRDRNVDLRSVPGVGYKVLRPGERVTHAGDLRGQAVRRVRYAYRISKGTDVQRLTEAERATYDHEVKVSGAMIAVGRASVNQVTSAAKAKALAG